LLTLIIHHQLYQAFHFKAVIFNATCAIAEVQQSIFKAVDVLVCVFQIIILCPIVAVAALFHIVVVNQVQDVPVIVEAQVNHHQEAFNVVQVKVNQVPSVISSITHVQIVHLPSNLLVDIELVNFQAISHKFTLVSAIVIVRVFQVVIQLASNAIFLVASQSSYISNIASLNIVHQVHHQPVQTDVQLKYVVLKS
jgi:hypothetical protein